MVVNLKKVFLFSSIVLLFAMLSQSVLAVDSLRTAGFNVVANISGVGRALANDLKNGANDQSNEFNRVETGAYALFLKNATYQFNITIYNANLTGNVSEVAITLPTGVTYNEYNATTSTVESSDSQTINVTFTQSGQVLNWTQGYRAINVSLIANTSGKRSFIFNATIALSGQNYVNFSVQMVQGIKGTTVTYVIGDRIYLDGKLPTLDSAKTNDTSSINLTFSEAVNVTTVKPMGATYNNRTGHALNITINSVSTANHESIVTLSTSDFDGNQTPVLTLNSSASTFIRDLAGNALTTNTSVTATDGAGPYLKYSVLNISGAGIATLTLFWSEPVSTLGTTVTVGDLIFFNGDGLRGGNYVNSTSFTTTSNISSGGYSGNLSEIVFSVANSANISFWRVNDFNLSLTKANWKDYNGNILLRRVDGITSNSVLSTHGNDTTAPSLLNWTYSHVAGQFALTFDEYVDPTYFVNDLNLTQATSPAQYYSQTTRLKGDAILLNASSVTESQTHLATLLAMNISSAAKDKIALWNGQNSSTALYLWNANEILNTTFKDTAGNTAFGVGHNSSAKYLAAATWTQDTIAPNVTSATISDNNVTGPGTHRITVTFSEDMTNATTVTLSRAGTSFTTYNVTLPIGTNVANLWYNFTTTDTNTEWVINVSNYASITDLSGNAMTQSDTGLKFTYDSVAPYVLYSYYLENGTTDTAYNGTLGIDDTLVFVFNEPLQVNQVNLSVGNFTFRDGGAMSTGGKATHLVRVNGNNAIITSYNGAPNISLRGEWADVFNATALQGTGSANQHRNLNANSSSWFIRDKADNFVRAAYTTAQKKVVADYAFAVTNSSPVTVSFPTCVNTGNMTGYLNTNDFTFGYYYNADAWGTLTTATSLRPLVGYRFTWLGTNTYLSSDASDNIFRVYLANQSDCALSDLEIDIKDGWNLLALNGNYYSSKDTNGRMTDSTDNWLFSLTSTGAEAGIAVGSVTKDYGNSSTYRNVPSGGDHDWDNLNIRPYEAWWVQSTSANSFTGVARR